MTAHDLTGPSPFAAEALNAKPYAFLDDAPLEERRTQAVMSRRHADPASANDLGRLDAAAIEAVREEAWPRPRDADEMHETLLALGLAIDADVLANPGWVLWLQALADDARATYLHDAGWVAAERLPMAQALYPDAALAPAIASPVEFACVRWIAEDAMPELLRGRLGALGPVAAHALAQSLALPRADVEAGLLRLEREGSILRGRFSAQAMEGGDEEWCERHLLARIHRYTVGRLRKEIAPVSPRDFVRFLADWQRLGLDARASGPDGLAAVIDQLEGYEAPASAWESELLRPRMSDYDPAWLDDLVRAGRVAWTRLRGVQAEPGRVGSLLSTPLVLLPRRQLAAWSRLAAARAGGEPVLGSRANRVAEFLAARGACFFADLEAGLPMLRTELEDALSELVARGRASCDSFAGLRALLVPPSRRAPTAARRGRRIQMHDVEDAGRWTLLPRQPIGGDGEPEFTEHVARSLLRRYGVVCWRLMEREPAWLPPWRELLRVYHRLEARGEIRGGRFIDGVSGEQFALPEAIGALRSVRKREHDGRELTLYAVDPANLLGTVLPGAKPPRLPGRPLQLRDGLIEELEPILKRA
jgi:ATP-dependent Lhr-like helicase